MIFVILIEQVLDDGTRFPQRDACVWVFNCWNTAVGIDVGERLLLNDCEVDVF